MAPFICAAIVMAFCYLFGAANTFRFLLYGPIAGALAGAVETWAAVHVWVNAGEPEFYFRGWNGVHFHLRTQIIAGGFTGIPFGVVLAVFEHLSGRRVRVAIFVPSLCLVTYVLARVIVEMEFSRNELYPVFSTEGLVMVVGLSLAVTFAKRKSSGDLRDSARPMVSSSN